MAADGGTLQQCLQELIRFDKAGDYQKALVLANKLIRRHPKETYSFKCKLIALINLQQYDEALDIIKKTPAGQMGDVAFEKAYIFYRLNKLDDALNVLTNCSEDDFRVRELRAQIFYKLDRFQEAYDDICYLIKNREDDFEDERTVNLLAIQAQLASMGVNQEVNVELTTYEQMYNAACQLIEEGKFEHALTTLTKSIATCRHTLAEEGLTEEEMESELASILVQQGFVLHRLGRKAEALEIYSKIKPTAADVKATLLNNIPSCSDSQDIAETRRSFKNALGVNQEKLTSRQRRILFLNNALLQLVTNQREPCRRALETLKEKYGVSKETNIIEAALLVKLKEVEKAAEHLSGNDLDTVIARVHILVNNGRYAEGLSDLSSLPKTFQNKFAVISLRVHILVKLGKIEDAVKELDGVINTVKGEERSILLQEGVNIQKSVGNWAAAARYLEELAKSDPSNMSIQGQLVKAYSEVDKKKADVLIRKLFPDTASSSLNVDDLEESDWILYGEKYLQKKEAKMDVDKDAEIITRKLKNRKRKRKVRLPKNYNPDVPPDPERWLPRQERAAYKKKNRRNRDRDIGRGTQGSAAANPNVEYSMPTPASPRMAGAPVAEGPRQMRPKQVKKKKKAGKF